MLPIKRLAWTHQLKFASFSFLTPFPAKQAAAICIHSLASREILNNRRFLSIFSCDSFFLKNRPLVHVLVQFYAFLSYFTENCLRSSHVIKNLLAPFFKCRLHQKPEKNKQRGKTRKKKFERLLFCGVDLSLCFVFFGIEVFGSQPLYQNF